RPLAHRRAVVCTDMSTALEGLSGRAERWVASGCAERGSRPVAFLFPGGGAQHVEMGRELYGSERVFREEVDRCAELLQPLLGRDIRGLIDPEASGIERAAAELRSPSLGLP